MAAITAESIEESKVTMTADEPSTTPSPEETAIETPVARTKCCPAGHQLVNARAPAGTCDGCGSRVGAGKLVSDCRQCNWYLCTTCSPIVECPKGHALRTAAAMAGKCDGCSKSVEQGAMVMDCRDCNFYLCRSCQPPTQCPSGHGLKLWVSQRSGHCGLCKKPTKEGEAVMDCRTCEWSLCGHCHPQPSAVAGVGSLDDSATTTSLPKCPSGHGAVPTAVGPGKVCDKCTRKIREKGMASECKQCNFHICSTCHPIRQCKKGHELEARKAPPGKCDGCGGKVLADQSVMDCKQCNWYLCGACHMSPVAFGGA